MLVVEDNAELRHVLKEALTAEGYQVMVARDEADALEQLRTNPVNLLISDITGSLDEDALNQLKHEFPDLPVLALSGTAPRNSPLFFASWQGAGRYRTLTKPFRLRDLLALSREVLDAAS